MTFLLFLMNSDWCVWFSCCFHLSVALKCQKKIASSVIKQGNCCPIIQDLGQACQHICIMNLTCQQSWCHHLCYPNRPRHSNRDRWEGGKWSDMFGLCWPIILLQWKLSGKQNWKKSSVCYANRGKTHQENIPLPFELTGKAFLSPLEQLMCKEWLNIKPNCCTLIHHPVPDMSPCLSCFLLSHIHNWRLRAHC